MMPPIVSVVLPVFNCESHILESVNSLLAQTFTDFELIVINDGSSDSTADILASIDDQRVRLFSRENKGISASLNEGIGFSQGKYIVRMDADDIALRNRLMLQVRYMQENNSVDILGGQAYKIDEKGVQIGEVRKPLSSSNIYKYIEHCCPVLHPTYCVKREVYEALRGYRSIPVEDYDFLLRAKESGFIIENLPDFIIKYRVCDYGLSLSNPYSTLVTTALVKKMHKVRVKGGSEEALVRRLGTFSRGPSQWFIFVFNIRNRLVNMRMSSRGIQRLFLSIGVALVSLLHIKILLSSFSIYRATFFVE